MRGGPGLGGIQPSQSDYFQATKGGGHGDYHMVVLAPASVQELYDMTVEAFNIADRYRVMTMILGDGVLGQMMEVVNFRDEEKTETFDKFWAANGHENKREHNMITSIHLDPAVLEQWNIGFQNKYKLISENEQRYELYNCEDADIILVAYGSVARICKGVIKEAAEQGIKLGLLRPITLFPFPVEAFEKVMDIPKAFLTVEMSAGQMVEDVRLTVDGRKPVYFTGRMGGMIPTVDNIMTKVMEIKEKHS
jgi:2-oxoglutarate ferredoxin oxidoreductase subunit alpha